MASTTKIEWTDATWNPITGCMVVSPGCTNCYAMRLAGTRLRNEPSRSGLTRETRAGPVWNGDVRFNRRWLEQPRRWRAPRMIFVCAHGDLFYEAVPDDWIDQVFAIMAICQHHIFQVLTKRPKRMLRYFQGGHNGAQREILVATEAERLEKGLVWPGWPLPNVWLGVSCEGQQRANERVPILLMTPAAIRFVSLEPLLGPIDLASIRCEVDGVSGVKNALTGDFWV
jgi:protein gp37